MFNLTVAHNAGDNSLEEQVYKADILYGTAADFQGDILRDEFYLTGVRFNRGYDMAIVDEVDNMLIDSKSHIVMLSSSLPAMDHLQSVLASIYYQIKSLKSYLF